MTTQPHPTQIDPADVIEIDDPEIDVDALMQRIRHNLATRLGPGGRSLLNEARLTDGLGDAFVALQAEMGRYGEIGSARTGLIGRAELLFKKVVRKAIRRHIGQQQDVNGALLRFLDLALADLEAARETQARLATRVAELESKLGS